MNYPDGQKVEVGDEVELWRGCRGTIVALIDEAKFAPDYEKSEWGYLERGVLVDSDAVGLLHQLKPDQNWKLVRRAA